MRPNLHRVPLVGPDEGLKHSSSVHCDELMSLPKARLTDFVSNLSSDKMHAVDQALAIALELSP